MIWPSLLLAPSSASEKINPAGCWVGMTDSCPRTPLAAVNTKMLIIPARVAQLEFIKFVPLNTSLDIPRPTPCHAKQSFCQGAPPLPVNVLGSVRIAPP